MIFPCRLVIVLTWACTGKSYATAFTPISQLATQNDFASHLRRKDDFSNCDGFNRCGDSSMRKAIAIVERIKELRKARKWSQDELANHADLSPRTIQNAEEGTPVSEGTLKAIAKALGVELEEILLKYVEEVEPRFQQTRDSDQAAEGSRGRANPRPAKRLQFFGFHTRDSSAIPTLTSWQPELRAVGVRIICFTLHSIDVQLQHFLKLPGIEAVEVFMSTWDIADRLDCQRQRQLFEEGPGNKDRADLPDYFPDASDTEKDADDTEKSDNPREESHKPRLSFYFYHAPPTFTGIALGESAYLLTNYLWYPTLHWLRDKDRRKYDDFWLKKSIQPPTPEKRNDDFTLDAWRVPSVLAIRRPDSPPGRAFKVMQESFEFLWSTFEFEFIQAVSALQQIEAEKESKQARRRNNGQTLEPPKSLYDASTRLQRLVRDIRRKQAAASTTSATTATGPSRKSALEAFIHMQQIVDDWWKK